jgi:hypothetical protein
MVAFEEKYLKGVTSKLIFWIVMGTVTICSTALGTYFGIKGEIKDALDISASHTQDIKSMKEDDKTRDLQIRAMQIQLNTLEFKVNEIYQQQQKK